MALSSLIRLPRRVIGVAGPDAQRFLDSLLTQRISPPEAAMPSAYAGLLTPQGKLIADLFVYPGEGGYRLDVAADRADDVLRRLRLYKLRAAVDIAFDDGLVVVAGVGEADPRRPELPPRGLVAADAAPAADAAAFARYEALRIEEGVCDPAVDAAPEEPFALEAQFEELSGVDFHKGCFVGQENVSRMKRRATTRRKFCRVRFEGPPPEFRAPVMAGEAALGEARSATTAAAIAYLRLDRAREAVERGETLSCHGRPLRLDPPPWLLLPEAGAET